MVVEVGVGGQDRLAVPALLYDAGELLFYFMLFTLKTLKYKDIFWASRLENRILNWPDEHEKLTRR